MSAIPFDTHAFYVELVESGLAEKTAEALPLPTSPKSSCKSMMLLDGNTIDFISFFRLVGNR